MRALPVALTLMDQARAWKLPHCGTPAREQVIDLAGAGDAEIGAMILTRDHDYVCEDPAAPVNLAGEMRAMGLMEPED